MAEAWTMTTALLIIDVQHGLFAPAPAPFEADAVIERINRLADKARASSSPVIFIQHERESGFLAFGSEGWQLPAGLTVVGTDIKVRKTTPDSFLRTDLAEVLATHGVQQLVVCGYASEFCVDTTTRRAAALGFPVTIAADAHTTHDKAHASGAQIRAHHNATLSSLTSFGPKIAAVAASEVVFTG
jgi:nicotinamidase-related amidase